MKNFLYFLVLASCCTNGNHAAAAGIAYIHGVAVVLDLSKEACDWSDDESDGHPGSAYEESVAAAEDADCVDDHDD